MSNGINKAIIVGNLGVDPEVRHMPGGGQVTNIRVATSERWKDKNTGEMKEATEWHRIVFFGRLAEVAADYLVKGSQVYIEGKLQTRKWQGQDGQDRYTTEIVGREMQMLGGRGQGGNAGGQHQAQSGGQHQAQSGGQHQAGGYGQSRPDQAHQGTGGPPPIYGFGEDDIPFAPVDGRFA